MAEDILNNGALEKSNDSSSFDSSAKLQIKPTGASGTEVYGGYFSEEYLQSLRGRRGAKVFDEIRRSESQVAMLLSAVMNPIKAGVWELEASAADENGIQKELVEYCLKEMIDWETFLHEALTFLVFGYSVFEVVNNVVYNHPKFGTFNGLKGLAFRSQKTIEKWNIDSETGELTSVTQLAQGDSARGGGSLVDMQSQFLLVFSLQKEGDNYEGISALRPMYGAWFRKNLYLKIMGIGIEKNAIGTPMGIIPAGKSNSQDEEAFKDILQNFTSHESAYLTVPEGWKIDILKNDFDPSKVKDVVIMENTEMINSMVANFLALGTGGGGGSFALGTDLSDFFLSGIQSYANIICGVLNRTLIPNLVKLNFGEQTSYPKIKATNINDKAGKELAEIISSLIGSKAIKADDKLEEFVRKQYSLPKADPATARAAEVPSFSASKQFSEIKLAESYKKQWNSAKDQVKDLMQVELEAMLEDLKNQISRLYKGSTDSSKPTIALKLDPKTLKYKQALQEALAEISNKSLIEAKKETPKAKSVKLSESIQLAAPKGGYFDALPPSVKRLVKTQATLIADTQAADLNKIVSLQYSSSQSSTDDLDLILLDIDDAAKKTIEGSTVKGMSVDAAAGNAVSNAVSQARLEWFFAPEVLDTIESFTFVNEDPISEVCQELNGTTWAVNDPDLDRYSPPLHHNCKSRLVPNEKGAEKNPEIDRGGTAITQKALDAITLCESNYGLSFELLDRKTD